MGLKEVVLEPAQMMLAQIGQFVVNAILVILLLIIGWIASNVIKSLISKVLKAVKLDELSERIKIDNMLTKGGIQLTLSELIGEVSYWLGMLITFVVAINAVGLTVAADLLNTVVLYIPNIIAAVFILILGIFIAAFLKNMVQAAANNAGIAQSNLLGKVVEIIVIVFAIAIALEQLNIGAKIIELSVGILLGSIGLALAIAFGFGCKDIAAKYLNNFIENIKSKK